MIAVDRPKLALSRSAKTVESNHLLRPALSLSPSEELEEETARECRP
jgi:hypothetical protein